MKYLIVGLGNVGDDYVLTRHNIGFTVIDHMVSKHHVPMTRVRHALQATIRHRGRSLCLIKPTDYMNRSGEAVAYWSQKLTIPTSRILVLVDDIALPFGMLRLRPKGGHGGHNGLANIEMLMGSQDYGRLRMGIGNIFPKGQQTHYVLGSFSPKELEALPMLQERAEKTIYTFCVAGIEHAMNQHN